jgi:uncharacterized protein DUF4124
MAVANLASFLVRLVALFLVLPLVFPLAASATIYKWTDENGVTVYSNRAPAAEAKVSNVQVALEDERPAAAQPVNPNDLQQRIRALEQQVQSLQNQPPAYVSPQQPPPVSYYAPPDYYPPQSYPSYPADYYSSMYGYGYPYYPYYPSYIVVTGRRFVRPVHPVHPVHHGSVGRPMPVSHAMRGAVAGGSRRR